MGFGRVADLHYLSVKRLYLLEVDGFGEGVGFAFELDFGLGEGEALAFEPFLAVGEGDGFAFCHAGGYITERTLQPGEVLRVDTGCIVAYTQEINYDIQFVGGIKNTI